MHLEQLDGRHLVQQQSPRVPSAEIDLLQVLIELARRKQMQPLLVFWKQRYLRKTSGDGRDGLDRSHQRQSRSRLSHLSRPSRLQFPFHHVAIERWRAAHRLTCVVDDEVETAARRQQLVAERLNARRVAQIEAEDLQSILPLVEVGLLRVADRAVAWKTRGDDEMRAAAQQLESRLVADLHASAGQQRDAASQVREFGALAVVQ